MRRLLVLCLAVGLISETLGQSRPTSGPRAAAPVGAKANSPKAAAANAGGNAQSAAPAPARRDIQDILASRVPEVHFKDTPLEDVMEWLEQYTGALVYVRWSVLRDEGIRPDTPITLKTRNRKLSRILWVVMNEASGASGATLAYQASDELIILSTHEDLSRNMVTRVYNVSDIILDIPKFSLSQMRQTKEGSEGVVYRTRVRRYPAPSAGAVGSDLGIGAQAPIRDISSEDERLHEFMELILNTIEPESWQINGYGGEGTIFPYKGKLIVLNSYHVHQMLDQILEPAQENTPTAGRQNHRP